MVMDIPGPPHFFLMGLRLGNGRPKIAVLKVKMQADAKKEIQGQSQAPQAQEQPGQPPPAGRQIDQS